MCKLYVIIIIFKNKIKTKEIKQNIEILWKLKRKQFRHIFSHNIPFTKA